MNFSRICFVIGFLLGAPAWAFPPAPDHVLYGTVRDELGRPLGAGSAVVIVSTAAGEIVRAPIALGTEPGANYQVRLPMDLGSLGTVYKPTALLPTSAFTIRVLMGSVVYLPIEVSRTGPTLGQPGQRTRLDLTLGVDSDNDGLPDAWERALIERDPTGRLRTLADVKPGDDLDGDGLTNLQEYLIGTYALDRLDGLALEVLAVESGRARLRFATVPGRVYTVRSSTNLKDWTSQAFALSAAGGVDQTAYSGRQVTVVEIWAPLPAGGTGFFRLYAE
ncbi:MAG: hypothetical protein WCQ89_07385 [Verrucomicrobiota bacterium]|jgi:hypothetical protein